MMVSDYKEACSLLAVSFDQLLKDVSRIQIGSKGIFPYGWRKAAKGRTVWRIVEEAIVQNLEHGYKNYGIESITPAESEVGVFDLELKYSRLPESIYINIKSAVKGGRTNKDDISKAVGLIEHLEAYPEGMLFVVTIELDFEDTMEISFSNSYVMPTVWLPDVYVNPSNNGNLQSSKYKDLSAATPRTNQEFLAELKKEKEVADEKRRKKAEEKAKKKQKS